MTMMMMMMKMKDEDEKEKKGEKEKRRSQKHQHCTKAVRQVVHREKFSVFKYLCFFQAGHSPIGLEASLCTGRGGEGG